MSDARTLGGLISTLRDYEELQKVLASMPAGSIAASAWGEQRLVIHKKSVEINDALSISTDCERVKLLCEERSWTGGLTSANAKRLRAMICRERGCTLIEADAMTLDAAANVIEAGAVSVSGGRGSVPPAKRRTGRPKRGEKGSSELVIAALSKWHGYEDGSVTNPTPAKNRDLTDEKYGRLSGNALTRFLDGKGGYKWYAAACRKGSIGVVLAGWRGEILDRHPDLLPDEPDRCRPPHD
jgi:hypothetical protein